MEASDFLFILAIFLSTITLYFIFRERKLKYKCPECCFDSDDPQDVFSHISEVHVLHKEEPI